MELGGEALVYLADREWEETGLPKDIWGAINGKRSGCWEVKMCTITGIFFFFLVHWVFFAACRLSLVAASGGLLFTVVLWLVTALVSLVAEHELYSTGFGSCGALAGRFLTTGPPRKSYTWDFYIT